MRKKLIEVLKYCASPEADCTKCERWSLDIESKCVEDLLLSAAIALEEKQATSDENKRWIPVTERLPEEEELVLILCKNGARFVGYCGKQYYDYERRWRIKTALNSTKLLNLGRVTHWMPLPEPPSEERRTDA